MKLVSLQQLVRLSSAALAAIIFVCQVSPAKPHVISNPRTAQLAGDLGRKDSADSFQFLSDPEWQAQFKHSQNNRESTESPVTSTRAATTSSPQALLPGKGLEPSVEASGQSVARSANPFLRKKRSTSCSTPIDLPEKVKELNPFLSDSQYVGLIPTPDEYIPLPSDQPHSSCPAATGSWWPRPEVNLRATCPWIWEELDNGPDAYPRHMLQAKCICTSCIHASSMRCNEIRHDVTIFRMQGCQNGVALMTKDVVTVTLGCFCAAPVPNDAQSSNSDDLPLTD
ncbi:interleukin-17d [Plakobranchus ocellatus]|uniref:Interleukin-17d n=1 Tax=Plakobranchus ocellatus TaxID=259542 RepID=A0AAV4D0U5_9GAST|nr:interleukin-17d [Plakobranchus ocellatus]